MLQFRKLRNAEHFFCKKAEKMKKFLIISIFL
jgi:hypothetical protein